MTDDNHDKDAAEVSTTKRTLMKAGATTLSLTALAGIMTDGASAQAAGEIGSDTPYTRAYIDRKVFVGRTSDPSTPTDGTEWYREDL